jgi:acyl-CoA thioesterase-1
MSSRFSFLCALFLTFTSSAAFADNSPPSQSHSPIKVACVGDSITQGPATPKGIDYPSQLQNILGSGWQVANYGLGGCTLLRNGNKPYWKQKQLQKALSFKPDIVVIMLGTNDSKAQNWVHESEFISDYRDLVKLFQGLDSKPRIYLCRVPKVIEPNKYKITETNSVIIRQRTDELAKEMNLTVIPTDQAYGNDLSVIQEKNDNVHPNEKGFRELAQTVENVLIAPKN